MRIEDIDDNFLIKIIRELTLKYNHACPILYMWEYTDMNERLRDTSDHIETYRCLFNIFYGKLLKLKEMGLVKNEYSHDYCSDVWSLV